MYEFVNSYLQATVELVVVDPRETCGVGEMDGIDAPSTNQKMLAKWKKIYNHLTLII